MEEGGGGGGGGGVCRLLVLWRRCATRRSREVTGGRVEGLADRSELVQDDVRLSAAASTHRVTWGPQIKR